MVTIFHILMKTYKFWKLCHPISPTGFMFPTFCLLFCLYIFFNIFTIIYTQFHWLVNVILILNVFCNWGQKIEMIIFQDLLRSPYLTISCTQHSKHKEQRTQFNVVFNWYAVDLKTITVFIKISSISIRIIRNPKRSTYVKLMVGT